MSCGMSSLSVCQPIAVRTPRSAPLPALWPGTWKRVEPRNPYATTALRYGAWGWSGEAMSAQACHDVFDDRVVLAPVHREVLAVAGRLEAAVRHLGDERQVVVASQRWTVMTGPKISFWTISSSWRRPSITVGSTKKPGESGAVLAGVVVAGARDRARLSSASE